jgi:putative transposase
VQPGLNRYTEALAQIGALGSVGSVGDFYDNAAESLVGLFRTELIRPGGPWRGLDPVDPTTPEGLDWFNNRRLHSAWSDVPPAEYEQEPNRQIETLETLEASELSLY